MYRPGGGSPFRGIALTQERRDVEIVVADLERRALTVVDPRAAVARAALPLRARGAQAGAVEAGGDHRHADLVGQPVVDDGAEDDVGVAVGRRVDDLRRLVDLEQAEVLAAGDDEQDADGALERPLEQRYA